MEDFVTFFYWWFLQANNAPSEKVFRKLSKPRLISLLIAVPLNEQRQIWNTVRFCHHRQFYSFLFVFSFDWNFFADSLPLTSGACGPNRLRTALSRSNGPIRPRPGSDSWGCGLIGQSDPDKLRCILQPAEKLAEGAWHTGWGCGLARNVVSIGPKAQQSINQQIEISLNGLNGISEKESINQSINQSMSSEGSLWSVEIWANQKSAKPHLLGGFSVGSITENGIKAKK